MVFVDLFDCAILFVVCYTITLVSQSPPSPYTQQ